MKNKFSIFCDEWAFSLGEKLIDHANEFILSFMESWQTFLFETSYTLKNTEYIEISLLRESLLGTNSPIICFDSFDTRWIMGGFLQHYTFEIPCFSLLFMNEKVTLLNEAKRYMGAVPSWVAEKIMLEKIYSLDETIARILKNNIDTLNAFGDLDKKTKLLISFGEYRRFQHTIYEVSN